MPGNVNATGLEGEIIVQWGEARGVVLRPVAGTSQDLPLAMVRPMPRGMKRHPGAPDRTAQSNEGSPARASALSLKLA